MAEPLIRVENLCKHFQVGRDRILKAVDGVSFTIDRRRTLGLVGESGCGKTTVGRSLVRLYRPTGGQILLDGTDIAPLSERDVLLNGVMGLCGESGEAIDIVKKWLMQGHELDREHLVRELGDVAWYLAEAATALDVPLEAVFQGNLDKLRQRFPNGFDTGASVNRKEGDL